eukprot:6895344-Prymnesium_polylepis.2
MRGSPPERITPRGPRRRRRQPRGAASPPRRDLASGGFRLPPSAAPSCPRNPSRLSALQPAAAARRSCSARGWQLASARCRRRCSANRAM